MKEGYTGDHLAAIKTSPQFLGQLDNNYRGDGERCLHLTSDENIKVTYLVICRVSDVIDPFKKFVQKR